MLFRMMTSKRYFYCFSVDCESLTLLRRWSCDWMVVMVVVLCVWREGSISFATNKIFHVARLDVSVSILLRRINRWNVIRFCVNTRTQRHTDTDMHCVSQFRFHLICLSFLSVVPGAVKIFLCARNIFGCDEKRYNGAFDTINQPNGIK